MATWLPLLLTRNQQDVMPKRKRETERAGAHLTQEPSVRPPLRKSARLLKKESHQLLPVEEQRRGDRQCGALPSPSTTGSTRENRCPTQLSEKNNEKLTNDTSFESHFRKTSSAPFGSDAGHKRKHENELGQFGEESRKRPRKDGLSKKQKVQLEEVISKTSVSVIESPEKSAKKLGVREIEQKERDDPISYWAAHHIWPENFAEHNSMASSNSTNKRPRTSDCSQSGKDERSPSYSQSRKNGEVLEPYTAAYEVHILAKGLDIDCRKGRDFVSEESKKTCLKLLEIEVDTIKSTAVPQDKIIDILYDCQARNEAIVQRDVTPLMIPSIRLLYYCGASHLEHVVDEVNVDWYSQCVLEGPQLRPDLAIGLLSSALTEKENDKLKRYNSVSNWTRVTLHMYFPFLMCEVQCGEESLDIADRQNMHSCSVAVRAILRIEQEADKYRSEKKMDSLSGQVLVFSISHDQQDTRLYGHYAIIQGEKWTYHRYRIRGFHLTDNNNLLTIHNFVRNILKSHLPEHVRRLKDALAALPDPNKLLESSGLAGSSGLSFTTDSQGRDADGFAVPSRPDSSQKGEAKKKGQKNESEVVKMLRQELERQRQESKEQLEQQRQETERQRQESKEQLEQQREENERQRQDLRNQLGQQISKLTDTISALASQSQKGRME